MQSEKHEEVEASEAERAQAEAGQGDESRHGRLEWRQWGSFGLSLVVGGAFLVMVFRGVRFGEVIEQIGRVSWLDTAGLVFLVIWGLGARGWRWWFTLPMPRTRREFWVCQRVLAVGYALNNVAPRLGELARIVMVGRSCGRPYSVVASTVILDRFLLDLLALLASLSVAMVACRQQVVAAFPHQVAYLDGLIGLSMVGLVGMLLFAWMPQRFNQLLLAMGVGKLGGLGRWLLSLVEQLSEGMWVLARPSRYGIILVQTVLIWGSYVLAFQWGLWAFDIELPLGVLVAVYAITTLGMVAPSPGGLGTFHFFANAALVALAGVDRVTATAFATYLHGINYVSLSGIGVSAFFVQRWADRKV